MCGVSSVGADGAWCVVHCATLAPAGVQTLYLCDALLAVLVPVAGRSGADANPDVGVAVVTAAFALLLTVFTVSKSVSFLLSTAHR